MWKEFFILGFWDVIVYFLIFLLCYELCILKILIVWDILLWIFIYWSIRIVLVIVEIWEFVIELDFINWFVVLVKKFVIFFCLVKLVILIINCLKVLLFIFFVKVDKELIVIFDGLNLVIFDLIICRWFFKFVDFG